MKYYVLGDILKELRKQGIEVREHQVLHVIRNRRIKEAMRLGHYRVFDHAAYRAILKVFKER